MRLRKSSAASAFASESRASADTAPVILVGLENTDESLRAAAYAIGLAGRQRAGLLFVQVWPEPVVPALFGLVIPVDLEVVARSHATLTELIRELIGDLTVEWELRQIVGYPRNEFVRLSAEVCTHAMVLGASSGRRSRRDGALAGRLMRTRRCPVIVVP